MTIQITLIQKLLLVSLTRKPLVDNSSRFGKKFKKGARINIFPSFLFLGHVAKKVL